jgi:hypothetical protein
VQKSGTVVTICIYALQKGKRKMRIVIVLLLLITVLRIIPAKVISDNNYFDDDDDDDDDDDEGQDVTQQGEDEDEDEEETNENPPVETESTPVDDEMNKALDEEWLNTAVKDIAYYLRAHKFNDFDRRHHLNEDTAPRVSNLNISETNGFMLHVQFLLSWLAVRCKGSETG